LELFIPKEYAALKKQNKDDLLIFARTCNQKQGFSLAKSGLITSGTYPSFQDLPRT
jgi:hypothetical protein